VVGATEGTLTSCQTSVPMRRRLLMRMLASGHWTGDLILRMEPCCAYSGESSSSSAPRRCRRRPAAGPSWPSPGLGGFDDPSDAEASARVVGSRGLCWLHGAGDGADGEEEPNEDEQDSTNANESRLK
jgi:hypothetical protein